MLRSSAPARLVLSVTCLVLAGTSCSGAGTTVRPGAPPEVSFDTLVLPPPALARPGLRIVFEQMPPGAERAAAAVPGVAVALDVGRARVIVRSGGRRESTQVMWVDPISFRSITSPSIRDAEFVWLSLLKGEALVAPRTARRLDISVGDSVRVGGKRVEVGAVADAWGHDPAGMILKRHVASRAGARYELLIGAEPGVDLAALTGSLRAHFAGARVERLRPGRVRDVPAPASSDDELIPPMAYRILEDGFIAPDPAWVEDNIATGAVPILGEVSCHRLVLPQLRAALAEIEGRGLSDLIDPSDYGGCFVPRFIGHDPQRPVSMHAFGLALDVNVSTNAVGTAGELDRRIVATFERWGFSWGGRWSPPDPMHVELTSLIRF